MLSGHSAAQASRDQPCSLHFLVMSHLLSWKNKLFGSFGLPHNSDDRSGVCHRSEITFHPVTAAVKHTFKLDLCL